MPSAHLLAQLSAHATQPYACANLHLSSAREFKWPYFEVNTLLDGNIFFASSGSTVGNSAALKKKLIQPRRTTNIAPVLYRQIQRRDISCHGAKQSLLFRHQAFKSFGQLYGARLQLQGLPATETKIIGVGQNKEALHVINSFPSPFNKFQRLFTLVLDLHIALRRNCISDVFLPFHVSRTSTRKRPLCATFAVILRAVRNSEAAVPVFGKRN